MCMLEYFSYCIPPKQCFLGAFQSQTVATLEGRTAAATGHVPVLLLNINSTATWSHRELNRTEWKMPLTHLCFFCPVLLLAGGNNHIIIHSVQGWWERTPKENAARGREECKVPSNCLPFGFLDGFLFYSSNNFTVALKPLMLLQLRY